MTWTINPEPVCGGISIIDENGRGVAIVIQRDPHPTLGQGVTLEEAERRARVMAMSPELLNALWHIVTEAKYGTFQSDDFRSHIARAENLIDIADKARGEA